MLHGAVLQATETLLVWVLIYLLRYRLYIRSNIIHLEEIVEIFFFFFTSVHCSHVV